MDSWKRITLVIFVLLGSTTSFAYWAIDQFDKTIDNLGAVYTEEVSVVPPKISMVNATSSTDLKLSFTFPKKDSDLYVGCKYRLSWQSSTTIDSLVTTLVDASTGEAVDTANSGLAKENTIGRYLQNLEWNIGTARPGAYYIKVLSINGVNVDTRSRIFLINKMSESVAVDEQKKICADSGGLS